MRTSTCSDVDLTRRMFKEVEDIFQFTTAISDANEDIPSQELQDMLYDFFDNLIQFRCALESAYYEGLDHFDQEG